jgi:hypothetical protein
MRMKVPGQALLPHNIHLGLRTKILLLGVTGVIVVGVTSCGPQH